MYYFQIRKVGSVIIDCGAAPGGWSQVTSEILKKPNTIAENEQIFNLNFAEDSKHPSDNDIPSIISIDLNSMRPIKGVSFIKGDFRTKETKYRVVSSIGENRRVGLILSDMAPNISGNGVVDDSNSMVSLI
ncbi:Ribosomal RNA large subunit methyltransferase E [Smittium mucronatum]|uniref:rRNA methyltransferase 2, mitochondrial n=1 Tax=Smittium mucronatum TaxID=133383 RepID=A0A1R0GVF5_9FUNG|nr:Ribosomal RNA large subunit methyltransferase E [Smittium mucronatum]